jgi:hypothetical protein
MRLSLKSMAISGALLWGGALLFVGLINLARPDYGVAFLEVMSSVYPWFHASRTIGDVLIATVDAFTDGAVAGLLFAWLYNMSNSNTSTK